MSKQQSLQRRLKKKPSNLPKSDDREIVGSGLNQMPQYCSSGRLGLSERDERRIIVDDRRNG
jgi:hypothetical protein